MKSTAKGMLKTFATRSVIAAIPIAMVTAYAGIGSVPMPPRMAEYAIQQVAEITVSPSTVGIAASPLYGASQAAINAQLDELQALGVQSIRVFVPWGLIEYADNTYDWSFLDRVMSAAAARNMGVMAEINGTPLWAAPSGTFPGAGTPPPAKFAEFLQQVVNKYGSTVSAYEIWNEPNYINSYQPIDPISYAALLAAAYPVIKNNVTGDPTATVVAGALGHVFTTGATMDPVEFIQQLLTVPGAINTFDAISYHPYDETLPFSQGNVNPAIFPFASDTAYNQIKDIQALLGPNKLVWLSEFGVPTTAGTTLEQAKQSQYIKDLLDAWQSFGGTGPVFLYTGRDVQPVGASLDPNDYFGLYTQAGVPKIAVAMLRQWLIDHPQTTTPPVDPPTDPNAALQAALQAFAQQLAQAFANAIQQAFVNGLGQQIANAIVNAIAAALAGLGQPAAATTVAPLALRVASIETPEATSTVEETAAKTAGLSATTGDESDAAVEAAAATDVAKAPAAAEVTAPTEVATGTAVTVTTPPATTPEVVTTPEATTPAVTTPVVVKEPAATAPSASTGTGASPTKGDADSPAKTKDDGTGTGTTSGDAAKSGDADRSGADKPGRSDRHGTLKGGNGVSASDGNSTAVTEKVTASVGVESATSESAATG